MNFNKNIFISLFILIFISCETNTESDLRLAVPEKVKYTSIIKPIMDVKCNYCHNGSTSISLLNYSQSKNEISEILNRIQRNEGSNGLMPQGGPKLSQAEINLFLKWNSDGLLE